ncbi:MAG: glycoside hydrolase family 28 protein, partial [Gemmataceae bacterium]
AGGEAAWAERQIPEVVGAYPECWMMGRLPAYGFYVRHADRVRLRNVEYVTDKPDGRPAIVCDDVEDAIFGGLELSKPAGDAPLLDLRDTRRVFVNGMRSPVGNKVFAAVSGAGSSGIRLLGNLLNEGEQAISITGGAMHDAAKVV